MKLPLVAATLLLVTLSAHESNAIIFAILDLIIDALGDSTRWGWGRWRRLLLLLLLFLPTPSPTASTMKIRYVKKVMIERILQSFLSFCPRTPISNM